MAQHLAAEAATRAHAAAVRSRREVGEVDCPRCEARGFRLMTAVTDGEERQVFAWCTVCEHTGRLVLVEADDGFFAVARDLVEAFLGGQSPDGDKIVALGSHRPEGFRYPSAGPRHGSDE